jgi:hypothetical protein
LLHPYLFSWLIIQPWRWRRHIPPKRQLTFNGLQNVISQKIELFTNWVLWCKKMRSVSMYWRTKTTETQGMLPMTTKRTAVPVGTLMLLICAVVPVCVILVVIQRRLALQTGSAVRACKRKACMRICSYLLLHEIYLILDKWWRLPLIKQEIADLLLYLK